MRLARELGVPNVNRMLRSMSGKDLVEWMAYFELEPFGEERADLRMAIQTAFLGNALHQMQSGESNNPFEPKDFMPQFGRKEPEPMSKEEAVMAIDAMFSALAAASRP